MLTARTASIRLLVALIGFGVLAAGTVLALEWRSGSRRAVAEAASDLSGRAEDAAEHIERDILERVRAVRAWVALDVAQEIAVDDVDKRLASTLRELARDLGAADLALALDPDGRIVASSDAGLIGRLAVGRFPGIGALDGAAVLVDSAKAPWIAIALPVVRHDGAAIGRLALLAPWARLVESGLAPSTLARLRVDGADVALYRGAEVVTSDAASDAASTDASTTAQGDPAHDARFVVGRAERTPAPGLPLHVTLFSPRSDVLAPVRAARRTALLAAAAVLLVLVPAALLLARTASRELARQEALATMGAMAAGLAHEIRTPLGVVRTSLELLARGGDAGRQQELAGIVREETGRLERLVDDLLAFARPRVPQRAPGDLAALVRSSAPLLETLAARHDAALELELSGAPVRVDADLVRQVLLNLVDNGARAAGPGGHVWITTRSTRDGGELTVRDSGPGVPAELRETLWEPFVTSRSTGTGLGLAIVHRIVEAHGGTATLDPSTGSGAEFRLTFPAA